MALRLIITWLDSNGGVRVIVEDILRGVHILDTAGVLRQVVSLRQLLGEGHHLRLTVCGGLVVGEIIIAHLEG